MAGNGNGNGKNGNGRLLTPKQTRWALAYFECENGTEAARRAGYSGSENTLSQVGHKNLRLGKVQDLLHKLQQAASTAAGWTPERVLEGLGLVAGFDPAGLFDAEGNMLPVRDMPEETRRALAGVDTFQRTTLKGRGKEVTRKVKASDRVAALDKLARIFRLYPDQHQPAQQQPQQVVTIVEVRVGEQRTRHSNAPIIADAHPAA